MTIRLRTAFLIGLGLFIAWFLYAEREILTPFVLAGVFAYIFNPIVNFFTHKVKLPRVISVLIIYILLISVFATFVFFLARGLLRESFEFRTTIESLLINAKREVSLLPTWLRPYARDTISSFENIELLKPASLFQFFPRAVSGIISLFVFLFASFYFLKEGKGIVNKALAFVPNDFKLDVEIILRRINVVLGGYLRGQIFMVFLISAILFIGLYLLGVQFALIIAIFSGIAEIVPLIGPIVATLVAVMAVMLGDSSNYFFTPIQTSIAVIIVYFIVRQVQDYFVIPQIMGRITRIHPLVILFAVLTGGHIAGILGLILAVPFAGIVKILLEFLVDAINDREILRKKSLGR